MMYGKTGILVLTVCLCLLGLAKGSCISYGHSCWGAHGKRAVLPAIQGQPKSLAERWALLKILPDKNFRFNTKFRPDLGRETLQTSGESISKPGAIPFFPSSDEFINDLDNVNGENDNDETNTLVGDESNIDSRSARLFKLINREMTG